MRCIITGATGFIGNALVEEMLINGYEVVAVIRPDSSKRQKLDILCDELKSKGSIGNESLRIIELGLDEIGKLDTEYNLQADIFYHLAWNGSAGCDRDDFDMQYSNIKYTADAIKTAKACGCKKIIGAGSQAEYGVVKETVAEDKTVTKPFMMYGAAKVAAYQMGQVLASQVGITFIWPRIYSVYGVGENKGTLISYLVDTLLKGEEALLSPCENMWNFIYITDCTKALRLLGEKGEEGIYNIASKDTRLLKGYVDEAIQVIQRGKVTLGAKPSNPERTFWLEPDVRKLEGLGMEWEVKFAEGIRRKIKE